MNDSRQNIYRYLMPDFCFPDNFHLSLLEHECWDVHNLAKMHFDEYPLSRDLFNISEDDLQGHKFRNWEENADYSVTAQIVIQIDTTNVTPGEYAIAPNITMITTNQALINIYRVWHRHNVSFSEFQIYYAARETTLNNYVENLVSRLNTVRRTKKKYGEWYINYALNDRQIRIRKPSD